MQISQHKVVTLDYTLTNDEGEILDRSQDGQFVYLHGAGNIIPGLEQALAGKSAGDDLRVSIEPEDAYGQRNEAMQQDVPREMFGDIERIEPGMQFNAQGPNGDTMIVTVLSVNDDDITIDGNHPLAGVKLNFEVAVVDIRDASEEEISHGHVHGPDGHGH